MQTTDKPEPQYVRIGWLVKHIGLSAETWRRLAALKRVRCLRPGGPSTYRVFDVKSCRDYLAGNIDAIQATANTKATNRERQAAFHRRFAANNNVLDGGDIDAGFCMDAYSAVAAGVPDIRKPAAPRWR